MAATPEQWALITGVSAGGLGDALTTELLRRGVNVIATGLHLSDLDYLQPAATEKLAKLELDVTSSSSIADAVIETQRITTGKLNFLFNNAGYGYMSPILDASMSAIRANFAVNVFGVIEMTQAFFPLLRNAQGMVVNQGSIAGLPGITQPYIGTYNASKCAMMNFCDSMRLELAPFGIRVVTLATGDVKTGFWTNAEKGEKQLLPANSQYQPIGKHVEAMMRGDSNPPGQHTSKQWASRVVDDLMRKGGPPSVIRRGFLASIMWVVSLLVPFWVLGWAFTKSCKLDDLKKVLQLQKRYESKNK